MSLFDGVQNFTPAFTGQQIAIEAGKGAGQSISRGMSGATNSKSQGLQQQKFDLQKQQQGTMMMRQAVELDGWANDYSGYIHD